MILAPLVLVNSACPRRFDENDVARQDGVVRPGRVGRRRRSHEDVQVPALQLRHRFFHRHVRQLSGGDGGPVVIGPGMDGPALLGKRHRRIRRWLVVARTYRQLTGLYSLSSAAKGGLDPVRRDLGGARHPFTRVENRIYRDRSGECCAMEGSARMARLDAACVSIDQVSPIAGRVPT